MGHGIALTFALGGYRVALADVGRAILDSAMSHVRGDLETLAEGGLISQEKIRDTLSRLTMTTNLEEAVRDADFVTESIIEDVTAKRVLFSDLDVLCPPHTILATNTSSLLIREFTSQCKRRDKILLTNWVNPPHIVPAVEIVCGEETSDETMELTYALLKKTKKMPVKVLKEVPGFIHNRVQFAMIREVWSLWQQGIASLEDIDTVVKASFGFRLAAIGPLETCDLGGLDVWYHIAERLFKDISNVPEPPEELKKMLEAGELGVKSGKGFFDYGAGKGQDEAIKERDVKLIRLRKLLYP
jgi:3-hydroxybutyryl-CoA dehydrogenase